ncbi:TPA: hypothetical protein OUF48_000730 [Enterococcus faecalis]|nr:hypothetical protein [Enterococcus faecalis]
MSKLSKINDLAFDLMHEYMEPSKQFSYGKQIYDLSDEPELNENQRLVLKTLKEQIQSTGDTPFQIIFWLMNQAAWDRLSELRNPIINLKTEQQIQLLRAFADWLEQEGTE